MTGDASERWFFGPPERPARYWAEDVANVAAGDSVVLKAYTERDGVVWPVAAKISHDLPERLELIENRLAQVAEISHPNLARQIESFVGAPISRTAQDDSAVVFYVISEWTEGQSLRHLAPVAVDEMLRIIDGVAGAVATLHDHGLVHRDLHPGNIIVAPSGEGVVIDYGTVRPDDGTTTTTVAGVMGFIAPDAVSGGVSSADDRWSVGMLAVFALLGHPQGRTPIVQLRSELRAAVGDSRSAPALVDGLIAMIDPIAERRPLNLRLWAAGLHAPVRRLARRTIGATFAVAAVAGTVVYASLDEASEPGEAVTTGISATSIEVPVSSATTTTDVALTDTSALPRASSTSPSTTSGSLSREACTASSDPGLPADFGAPDGACWGEGTDQLHDIEVREVIAADTGSSIGVVIARPDEGRLFLPTAAWLSYREIAGRSNPANAPVFGGYPTSVDYLSDPGGVAVELDGGGVLVGPRSDSQLFWVHPAARDLWEQLGGRTGELGYPASNIRVTTDGAVLEFEHGYMTASPEVVGDFQAGNDDIPIDVVYVDDREQAYDGEPPKNVLVSQWNGVAWWIDSAGRRHWVQDGASWNCLGGQDALEAADLPGWAVWIYPIGPVATCPEDTDT